MDRETRRGNRWRTSAQALAVAMTVWLAGLPATGWADPGVTPEEVVIGQSLALSGPIADLTREIRQGVDAAVNELNQNGGVHGRRLRVITLDDGYDVTRTVRNVDRLIREDKVFALFNVTGTPHGEAVMPLVKASGIPFFSPFSGADSLRNPMVSNVFHVRAGYRTEIERLVRHLKIITIQRIGVVYQANSFGADGLAGVRESMKRHQMQSVAEVSIQADGSNAEQAVAAMAAAQPDAVILITAGRPTFAFIKGFKQRKGNGAQIYTLSVMGTARNIQALGAQGLGVVVSAVMPYPWSSAHPLVKDYQAAMAAMGHSEYAYASLESYVNTRLLAEVMRRAGPRLTRRGLIDAAESMEGADFSGLRVGFSPSSRQGLQYVELVIIGSNGRFIR